ncbi:MAG: hypothetical protein K0Q78_1667 [Cellvibrio sp.]|nr:hypothetical protein [Cellvibrio sp.]
MRIPLLPIVLLPVLELWLMIEIGGEVGALAVIAIIPGFITDFIALLCLIPFVRRLLLKRWLAKIAVVASAGARGFSADRFKADPFTSTNGNIYEHQGSPQTGPDKTNDGVLIDQQPQSSASKPSERD